MSAGNSPLLIKIRVKSSLKADAVYYAAQQPTKWKMLLFLFHGKKKKVQPN